MIRNEPIIVVENLSFRYQGRKLPALQDVSFSVSPGELLLVLGPSGSGKSTLALCLNGLIPHDMPGELSGRVMIAGRAVRETPVADLARTVGMVFQDPDAQFCMLRVDDEIAFGLENLRVPRTEMAARISRALELVGLAGSERRRIDRLSGGERQRLALACVLAMEPSVLVFDEPTSNLDPAGAEELFATIARLKQRGGRSIVIVEHRLDHLISLVDRVLVLGPGGRRLALASPTEVLRDHADELDSFGIWIPQVSEVANRLAALGLPCDPYPLTIEQAAAEFDRVIDGRPTEGPVSAVGNGVATADGISASSGARGRRFTLNEGAGPTLRCYSADSPTDEKPAIEIERLAYRYPGGQTALRDVSLVVHRGSFFALVGPNGAGKSTLASHLIGSIRPPAGRVRLFGRDVRTIATTEIPRYVGYVFQNPEHQFVAGSVFEELAFGLRIRGQSEPEITAQVDAVLADFGLSSYARANPFTLSHGEKRRLSVATMLILGQPILVLDEPTFGQDRRNTAALMAKLLTLNRDGRTIVMITHDLRLVAEYATEVALLVDGLVAYHGPVAGLFNEADLLERGHLIVPPLLELSRRLDRPGRPFPPIATVEQFVVELLRDCPRRPPVLVGQESERP